MDALVLVMNEKMDDAAAADKDNDNDPVSSLVADGEVVRGVWNYASRQMASFIADTVSPHLSLNHLPMRGALEHLPSQMQRVGDLFVLINATALTELRKQAIALITERADTAHARATRAAALVVAARREFAKLEAASRSVGRLLLTLAALASCLKWSVNLVDTIKSIASNLHQTVMDPKIAPIFAANTTKALRRIASSNHGELGNHTSAATSSFMLDMDLVDCAVIEQCKQIVDVIEWARVLYVQGPELAGELLKTARSSVVTNHMSH